MLNKALIFFSVNLLAATVVGNKKKETTNVRLCHKNQLARYTVVSKWPLLSAAAAVGTLIVYSGTELVVLCGEHQNL